MTRGFQPISDENAESIGSPILKKVIQSFMDSDREQLIQNFPELDKWMTPEVFDEAVENLKPMGQILSKGFLARLNQIDHHLLVWKICYEKEDEDLLWYLYLTDVTADIKVAGFAFSR